MSESAGRCLAGDEGQLWIELASRRRLHERPESAQTCRLLGDTRMRRIAPKPTPTLTPAIGQVGWKADRGLQQAAYNAERDGA
jgi:hypothetical protein